jgi:hypothetical protein
VLERFGFTADNVARVRELLGPRRGRRSEQRTGAFARGDTVMWIAAGSRTQA